MPPTHHDDAPFATRFAPSPSGLLHLGHAFSALTAFEAARRRGGRFVLRNEDLDQGRRRPEFEDAICEDLSWLGLAWETPVLRQSERLAVYATAIADLAGRGLAYRCFRRRKEVMEEIARAPHGAPEVFFSEPLPPDEEQARLAAGEAFAWRLSIDRCRDAIGSADLVWREEGAGPDGETGRVPVDVAAHGDVVIGRKDAGASYHLASVIDDAAQGITHVIRGEDLFASSHVHRLLQALLGLPAPTYRHHRLILDETGRRFAKRDRAVTLRALREAGWTPADVRRRVGLDVEGALP